MKKFLMLLIGLTLMLALAACSEAPKNEAETDVLETPEQEVVDDALIDVPAADVEAPVEDEVEEEAPAEKPAAKPEQKPAEQPAAKPEQKPSEPAPEVKPETTPEQPAPETSKSPAKALLSDFKAKVSGTTDPEALASALIANEIIPFMGASMAVEPGFLNGFTNEIGGFAKGAMFGPAIGTIPFIGYIFEVDANTDVNAFITTLKDNADLRWNICTSADEMVVDSVGKTVFFVMAPAQFEE